MFLAWPRWFVLRHRIEQSRRVVCRTDQSIHHGSVRWNFKLWGLFNVSGNLNEYFNNPSFHVIDLLRSESEPGKSSHVVVFSFCATSSQWMVDPPDHYWSHGLNQQGWNSTRFENRCHGISDEPGWPAWDVLWDEVDSSPVTLYKHWKKDWVSKSGEIPGVITPLSHKVSQVGEYMLQERDKNIDSALPNSAAENLGRMLSKIKTCCNSAQLFNLLSLVCLCTRLAHSKFIYLSSLLTAHK